MNRAAKRICAHSDSSRKRAFDGSFFDTHFSVDERFSLTRKALFIQLPIRQEDENDGNKTSNTLHLSVG